MLLSSLPLFIMFLSSHFDILDNCHLFTKSSSIPPSEVISSFSKLLQHFIGSFKNGIHLISLVLSHQWSFLSLTLEATSWLILNGTGCQEGFLRRDNLSYAPVSWVFLASQLLLKTVLTLFPSPGTNQIAKSPKQHFQNASLDHTRCMELFFHIFQRELSQFPK